MAKRRPGTGAVAHCLSHYIHPSAPIREKNPNRAKGHTLTNLFINGRAEKSSAAAPVQNHATSSPPRSIPTSSSTQ